MGRKVALKVDVDTLRGTLEGVPGLLSLFDRHGVKATFLFSVGPDHTGRALRRVFRPGFLRKATRTSVVAHYGVRTLLYGVLLPGPHIGRKAGHVMREVAARGHEVGVHCFDHVRWQDNVASKDEEWTRREMRRAWDAFTDALGSRPTTIGAAGWQINRFTLALEEEMGFCYASDCRGVAPFYPLLEGVSSRCVQIPTTLPTLDEIIGMDGITARNAHEPLLQATRRDASLDHVYTMHAELEGLGLRPAADKLLARWAEDGADFVTLQDVFTALDPDNVPTKQIAWRPTRGRSGLLATEATRGETVDEH